MEISASLALGMSSRTRWRLAMEERRAPLQGRAPVVVLALLCALLALGAAACATATPAGESVDASGGADGTPGADARVVADARNQVDGTVTADAIAVPRDGCVLGTVDSCSECGVPCPGIGQATANVECRGGGTCTFSCAGENYDVNGLEADGCEAVDAPTGNHAQANATYLGALPCYDSTSNPNVAGLFPSDARAHENPSVAGLNDSVGAAPDWYRIQATGGLCENNLVLTFSASGSGGLDCYKLSADTDKNSFSCVSNSSGGCTIDQSALGQYSDGTDIYLKVEKTCLATMTGMVSYSVTGHL